MSEVLDSFELEWHGNTVVVIPAKSVESLNWDLVEQAADVIMEPLASGSSAGHRRSEGCRILRFRIPGTAASLP